MTLLAVTADLHADDLGHAVNPATGLNRRFEDALGILRWIAQDAHARGCEALIVAGDLTEQRHPAPWRVALIREALEQYPGPIIFARGNHDGLRAGRSIVDVLADDDRQWWGFSRPGVAYAGDVSIAVLPYLDRSWLRTQPGFEAVPDAEIYRVLGEQFLTIARGLYVEATADGRRAVLVVHQGLSGGAMTEQQQAFLGDVSLVVDTGALAAIGFDAVFAGHFHMHQVLRTDPLVVYAGAPHRVTFQEEHQPKGYLVVDTDKLAARKTILDEAPLQTAADAAVRSAALTSSSPAFEFVETPARRFVTLRWIDLPGGKALINNGSGQPIKDAVVRVIDVPAGTDTADIRRRLEQAGAYEVADIRALRETAAVPSGGLSEGLTPQEAVASYFDGDEDAPALLERAHAVLAEVR